MQFDQFHLFPKFLCKTQKYSIYFCANCLLIYFYFYAIIYIENKKRGNKK